MPKEKVHYIYKIHFLCGYPTGRYYLGKHTGQIYDSYAGSGKFCKSYYKKYGKIAGETYVKEILEINPDKKTNHDREIVVIGDLWKTDPLCMNQLPGGACDRNHGDKPGMLGKHHSAESKKKISEANKGRKWTEAEKEAAKNRPKISEETREKLRKSHLGLRNALGHKLSNAARKNLSEKLTNNPKLKAALKNKVIKESTREKYRQRAIGNSWSKGHVVSQEQKDHWSEIHGKKVDQYTLSGEFVATWRSVSFAAENQNSNSISGIINCCNKKKNHKTAFGYIWKWHGEELTKDDLKRIKWECSRVVIQMDKDDNELHRFEKIKDAEKELGIHHSAISSCCSGKRKLAGGYKWKYVEE